MSTRPQAEPDDLSMPSTKCPPSPAPLQVISTTSLTATATVKIANIAIVTTQKKLLSMCLYIAPTIFALDHRDANRHFRCDRGKPREPSTQPPPTVMQQSSPLHRLPPLPKPHHSWPILEPFGIEAGYANRVWEDYVRIAGSFPVMIVDLDRQVVPPPSSRMVLGH